MQHSRLCENIWHGAGTARTPSEDDLTVLVPSRYAVTVTPDDDHDEPATHEISVDFMCQVEDSATIGAPM
jgi:hypothetical protein